MEIEPIRINPEDIEAVREKVADKVATFLEAVPNRVQRKLDKAIEEYLGVKTSFGRFEFHPDSVLKALIDNKTRKVVENMIDDLVWEPTEEELETIRLKALQEYKSTLQRWINSKIRDLAQKRIKQWESEFEAIQIVLDEPIREPTPEEMSDPNYGKSPLQKALLEAQIQAKIKE